jgi:uncharacterized protein
MENNAITHPSQNGFALVTGASSGIGEAFARELAARGWNLLITARRGEVLNSLARELHNAHRISVNHVAADLGTVEGIEAVVKAAENLQIDLLVNNAGFGTFGYFKELSPERLQSEIALNISAPVALARHFLPAMIKRKSGAILNVASTAGFQPVAKFAAYSATKSFILNWSEALWAECRGTGVNVTALCPGHTRSRFFEVAGAKASHLSTPQEVVRAGLRALERNHSYTIAGLKNYLKSLSSRFMPRRVMALIATRVGGIS